MRSRLLASAGALALTLGGLLTGAGPAAADPAHCSGWDTHPDVYSGGAFSFGNGSYIRTGPYTDCSAVGQGFPGQGLDVHCGRVNASNVLWFYLENTSTSKAGWVRVDAVNWGGAVVRDCVRADLYYYG